MRKLALDLALSLVTVGLISLGIGGILSISQVASLQMLYILGILWLAANRGRMAPLLACAEAFLIFDWFFLPPYHTLDLEQPQEWVSLGIFLIVALVAGQAYALERRQAIAAEEHDRRTQLLYDASSDMTVAADLGGKFDHMLETLARGLGLSGLKLYVWRDGCRELSGGFEHSRSAGNGPAPAGCVPCRIGEQELAEMEVFQRLDGQPLGADDLRVLRGFANQLANALERRRLEKEEQLNQLLAEANRTKTSLLAAVSHDLRTPLAAIKASATSLLQGQPGWDEGTRHEFLTSINNEADRLDRLVANLLDMSRIESGALTPRREWHNLSEIAADVIDRLQPVANSHELQLVAEDREFLSYVDYIQMSQVLTNLVDNAIRHGAPGRPIEVHVSDGRISVENSGRQLSQSDIDQIFDRFYRGEDQASGTGLGLAIAKGVVEAHGGRIWAENTGTGVAFHLTLPPGEGETAAEK